MISWLGKGEEMAWDEYCPWLSAVVCEVHDDDLKGHIVLQFEGIEPDDIDSKWYEYQLDLGDCSGFTDTEINERFCNRFQELVDEYENDDECCGPILDDLRAFADEILVCGN